MAINIKIGSDKEESKVSIELNIRKTLDGDLMIFDHSDIDIIIMSKKGKILTLPKELITDQVYGAQNRLFSFLRKKGIINFDSIQGGNVYGSMEATLSDAPGKEEYALLNISKFIDEERPYFDYVDSYMEEYENSLTEPDNENSTELGDVEHSSQKGSLNPDYMTDMYGLRGIVQGY